MASTESSRTILRRANGRLQACDRCRTRKVACDHARPICGRCKKRKGEVSCTYTLSANSFETPITVQKTTSRFIAPPRSQAVAERVLSPVVTPGSTGGLTHGSRAPPSHSVVRSPFQPVSSHSPQQQQSRASQSAGYQGFTSLATVIDETLPYLTPNVDVELPDTVVDDVNATCLQPHLLDLAYQALQAIPHPDEAYSRFGLSYYTTIPWLQTIASKILPTLYESWGSFLGHDGKPARLQAMAEKLSANTAVPLLDVEDGNSWLEQFSGPSLRWETLGLLFVFWRQYEEHETGSEEGRTSSTLSVRLARNSVSQCLDLALEFSPGNHLVVHLSYRRMTWESLQSGDASLATWRQLADCVAMVTFHGLHAESLEKRHRSTFLIESERRMFAHVYNIDKVAIAFTGRPPLLSRRFISTPMPLDLSNDDLFLPPEALAARVRDSLDENGWNKAGALYSATTLRARSQLARITDQIAEVALGQNSSAAVLELNRIQQEQRDIENESPPQLLFKVEQINDPRHTAGDVFIRLLIAIERLQNDFFLHRLFISHGQPHEDQLLTVSFDLVTLVLHLWTNKDRFDEKKGDFAWLLVGYGASPGGILCKNLLRARDGRINSSNPSITRSAIIQKLSLLVGFLDWLRPSAPNADLCRNAKSVIQRVLNQVLDRSPEENNGTTTASLFLDDPSWSMPMLDFNFDLMDTYDWLRVDPLTL